MQEHGVWQMVVVDWDSRRYATIETPTEEQDVDRTVSAAKNLGRDVHCFRHDFADTFGLLRWARQHRLTQTDAPTLLAIS